MKFRPHAVTAAVLLTASLEALTLAPAHADANDPVTGLAVTQSQGSLHRFVFQATWTANPDADAYRVTLTDHADGTNSGGATYDNADVRGTSASLATAKLVSGHHYWVNVAPVATDGTEGTSDTIEVVAQTLDVDGPAGAYRLDRTRAYLSAATDEDSEDESATFTLTQTSLSDNTSPNSAITRQILSGDGSAAVSWTSGTTHKIVYTRPGTFTPKVTLTDGFGNQNVETLPAITVLEDTTAPRVSITRPAAAQRSKVHAWRAVHGLVSDSGTGVAGVGVFEAEKRGSHWYAYDFDKRTWVKGKTTLQATMQKTKASGAFVTPHGNHWRAPAVKGLTKGTLHVEVAAFDQEFNLGFGTPVTVKLTAK